MAFAGVGVKGSLHLCDVRLVTAQRFDVSISVVHVGIVTSESALVTVDV